jgi:hypothetical protein
MVRHAPFTSKQYRIERIRAGIKAQTKREMKSYIQTEMAQGKNITMKTNRKTRIITINGRRFFIV